MKKKIVATLLVSAMAMSLVACGSKDAAADTTTERSNRRCSSN